MTYEINIFFLNNEHNNTSKILPYAMLIFNKESIIQLHKVTNRFRNYFYI